MAKLVDARDLKSLGAIHAGSTPAVRTIIPATITPAPRFRIDLRAASAARLDRIGRGSSPELETDSSDAFRS